MLPQALTLTRNPNPSPHRGRRLELGHALRRRVRKDLVRPLLGHDPGRGRIRRSSPHAYAYSYAYAYAYA